MCVVCVFMRFMDARITDKSSKLNGSNEKNRKKKDS